MRLKVVRASFEYDDGTKIEASFGELGWEQSGASTEKLGQNVDVLEAVNEALSNYICDCDEDIPENECGLNIEKDL